MRSSVTRCEQTFPSLAAFGTEPSRKVQAALRQCGVMPVHKLELLLHRAAFELFVSHVSGKCKTLIIGYQRATLMLS